MNTKMVGIILAGGSGTRLGELTKALSKQLLPVYNQPMIYYPLKTLIDMGIDDILIIVASREQESLFKKQLGDGDRYGIKLTYCVQEKPNGLAEAFIIGEKFIGNSDVALILGDNVFLVTEPIKAQPNTIFVYKVKEPSAYGVAKLNKLGELDDIVEKPKKFISDDAVVGLYVFNSSSVDHAKRLTPSARGELEIVDLIKSLKSEQSIEVKKINGEWFDCGNVDDLLECSEFVRALTKRTQRDIVLNKYE